MSLPLRATLRFIASVALVWALATYLPSYVAVTGGMRAYVFLGLIIGILNLIVRPILTLITLPLRLLMTIAAFFAVNGAFLWLLTEVAKRFDPSLVTFHINGGISGWCIVIFLVGFANWLMKHIL